MALVKTALMSAQIPGEWSECPQAESHPETIWYTLQVPEVLAHETADLLGALWLEEYQHPPAPIALAHKPLWLQPPFAAAVSLMLFMVMVFVRVGGQANSSVWFRSGTLTHSAWLEAHYWLTITAATLHADLKHLLGNMTLLLVLGWGVAERKGIGSMVLGFVLTAAFGFIASMVMPDPPYSTVGASGGIFGLLGIAGGHAALEGRKAFLSKRGVLRGIGAAVMLFFFTAINPSSNMTAHVAGFVWGVALALASHKMGKSFVQQAFLLLLALTLMSWAWIMAVL